MKVLQEIKNLLIPQFLFWVGFNIFNSKNVIFNSIFNNRVKLSSNINEVIRALLDFVIYEKIHTHKKHKTLTSEQK